MNQCALVIKTQKNKKILICRHVSTNYFFKMWYYTTGGVDESEEKDGGTTKTHSKTRIINCSGSWLHTYIKAKSENRSIHCRRNERNKQKEKG